MTDWSVYFIGDFSVNSQFFGALTDGVETLCLALLSDLLFPLISQWALRYTSSCTRKQVERRLEKISAQYGPSLELSEEDLGRVSRGDLPVPFTIALALWTKYRKELTRGLQRYVDWLNQVHPVYQNFPLRFFPGSDTHGKFTPDLPLGLGQNYPRNKEAYNRELKEALALHPKR